MNTLKLSLIGAVIIAAVAAPWLVQHQAQAKLRAENDSLRTQLQQIAILTRENAHLSNLVAQGERAQAEMAKQLKDLPRLRGEAGALRAQTNDVARLRQENRKLQTTAAARKSPLDGITPLAQIDLTKDTGTFAGYATPEAAMQTLMWAHHNLNFKAVMECLTPEEKKGLERQLRESPEAESRLKAKVAHEMAQVKSVSILDKQVLSDNQILFHIYLQGPEKKLVARFRKIDGDWKFDNFDGN